jgi:hypothetical protein
MEQAADPSERAKFFFEEIDKSPQLLWTAGLIRRGKLKMPGVGVAGSVITACSDCLTIFAGAKPKDHLGHRISAIFSAAIRQKKGTESSIEQFKDAVLDLIREGEWVAINEITNMVPHVRWVNAKTLHSGRVIDEDEICYFSDQFMSVDTPISTSDLDDAKPVAMLLLSIFKRYPCLSSLLFDEVYKPVWYGVASVVDQVMYELSERTEDAKVLQDKRLGPVFCDLLRELVIRADRYGNKEDRWWEQPQNSGHLFFAGLKYPIGESSSWMQANPARFFEIIAHKLVVRGKKFVGFPSYIQELLKEDIIKYQAIPTPSALAKLKKDAAAERRRKSRMLEAANANTEEGKAKRDEKNQNRRNLYQKNKKAAKDHEDTMLGKRSPNDESIDINEAESEG